MPGVLVDDSPSSNPPLPLPAMPHPPPPHLLSLRHYIPVLTGSSTPDFRDAAPSPPSHPLPIRRPRLNVNSLPDMYSDDGTPLEPGLLLQLSPASVAQWGCSAASPTTLSALSALRQFLPSNFEEDEGGKESQMDVYSCEEFRMYEFKVRRCMRGRSHDWTECPFAHPGEKARRRDPRRFHYSGTPCADFRKGSCKKGDGCEYAHGVFECWLHPARYRTQPCKDGRGCRRRICFFAHTRDQLRVVSPVASSSPSVLSSSPTSLRISSAEIEALELCACMSPIQSPKRKAASDTFSSPLASSPLCHMAMEAPPAADGLSVSKFSLIPPISLSPPISPSLASPSAHVNWSPGGISTFALPSAAMPQPLHLNRMQALPSGGHSYLERLNQELPHVDHDTELSTTLNAAPSSGRRSTMRQIEDLVGLLKNANLKEEGDWQVQATTTFCDGNVMLQNGMYRGIGMGMAMEGEMVMGGYGSYEEEGEPKLERVESGKGLRAQIFKSLLKSCSETSGCTEQDSNSAPLEGEREERLGGGKLK